MRYNFEEKKYDNIIKLEEIDNLTDKLQQISNRLHQIPNIKSIDCESEDLIIDDITSVKSFISNYKVSLNKALNRQGSNLYLIACYFSKTPETIEYLIEQGTEVNRIDLNGNNAIISIVLNGNMSEKTKLQAIQMLIDKGCDVNWHNSNYETALYTAIKTLQLDIANLLIDNGANDIC